MSAKYRFLAVTIDNVIKHRWSVTCWRHQLAPLAESLNSNIRRLNASGTEPFREALFVIYAEDRTVATVCVAGATGDRCQP